MCCPDGQQLNHGLGESQHVPGSENAFGRFLRRLREGRNLSLRDLGLLSGVDHAYIHRLETGEKEAPSAEIVGRLIRHLKADDRQAGVLRILAEVDAPQDLVDLVLSDQTIDLRDFQSAAQIKYRGKARPKWDRVIKEIRGVRDIIERG